MGVELRMGLRVVGVDPFGVDTEGADGDEGARRMRHRHLGGRSPGLAAGRPPGRGHRSRDRPRRAGSPCCPISACPGTPRSSPSATWRRRQPSRRLRGGHAGRPACRQHDQAAAEGRRERAVQVPRPRQRRRHRPLQGDRQCAALCGSAASRDSSSGCSCTWPSSTGSATASPRCGAGAAPWSGTPGPNACSASGTRAVTSACPTRSRPRSCRSPFPILEDQMGWADLVARVGTPACRRTGNANGAAGSDPA